MNHLRLVMATCTHGFHVDNMAGKDCQKWEVVLRLKFLSIQTCLIDIAYGNNSVTKDASVYGTCLFLYVCRHYTEIFFSLHASLCESIMFAALVVIFFSLWLNWILISNAFSLKQTYSQDNAFKMIFCLVT